MNKIIIILMTTINLFATEWSTSQFNITTSSINSWINTNLNNEIKEVEKIETFYEDKIQKQVKTMEENSVKLLKLQTRQNIVIKQIEKIEKQNANISSIENR